MEKRGQVTLFIILGIIALVVIGFIYLNREIVFGNKASVEENKKFLASRLEPIKTLVQDCVQKSALKGLIILGKQGGRFNPARFEDLTGYNVSYSCFRTNEQFVNLLPLISEMNSEFLGYMQRQSTLDEINKCVDNFKKFKSEGLDVIEKDTIRFSGDIQESDVKISIEYPLEISKGDYTAILNSMATNVPVGIGKAHKIAAEISNKECNGEEFDFDSLGLNEPIATSSIQEYKEKKIVYLKTIPSFKDEIPIDFNFILDK